ncbi:hypothetical protein [Paraburkholderia sp. CNPSo 3281]|uniref:hypothetical protein n=1 Tax=Paraburkholderia sp. CNPSo 3281 TaxID=2940933 RepID=UPI0020B7149F|nr:hypothetical protein [Paraburkholderia sp. CNPSo 3281]MCP3714886.1 hypothetical protein [Paraburkholderia sp. CNPSo 3281]
MSIIGNLPDNLQNGTTADASQVMADLNFIVNQVNANAVPLGTLAAPSGTSMAFQQASAPAGWVAQTGTAFQDAFLRCNTPSNYSATGGSVNASTLFEGPITGDGHTLLIAEMPTHSHTDSGHGHGTNESPHSHGPGSGSAFYTNAAGSGNFGGGGTAINTVNSTAGAVTGLSIQTGNANIQNNGGGGAHSHTLTANCKYVDQIIATKS